MPSVKHNKYLWYVDKNVFINYKLSFDIEES